MSKPSFQRSRSIAERNLAEMAAKMEKVVYPKIWLQKMKNVFHMLDIKNRGYICRDSFGDLAEAVVKQSEMSQKEADAFKSKMMSWTKDVKSNTDSKMAFEQFCKTRYLIISEPELWEDYRGFLSEIIHMVFLVIDTNGDGYISPKEWAVYHGCIGVFDQTISQKIFELLDLNKDGLISEEEYRTAYLEFIHSQESGKYDLMHGPLTDVPAF